MEYGAVYADVIMNLLKELKKSQVPLQILFWHIFDTYGSMSCPLSTSENAFSRLHILRSKQQFNVDLSEL